MLRASLLLVTALGLQATQVCSQNEVPSPESVLGYQVGADFKLATYEDSRAYFEMLAEASDSMTLLDVGFTTDQRPFTLALISSPENLAEIERQRQISLRLAHPKGLSEADARELARDGLAFVHIDGGVHSSEVAGAQHSLQLAYDLLSSTGEPAVEAILSNVVLMLWPTLNPDGQTMIAEWYRSNVGTPYEISSMPWLYQRYVDHDNNRDAYMLNMIESRVIGRTWREWEPQIIYVHHQTAPFPTRIWLPPFSEPIGVRTHPLMTRTVNSIGMLIAQALEERGQVGATHKGSAFDAWYPGYIDYLPNFQNSATFWTETALYEYATPHFYEQSDFPRDRRSLRAESLYASPWRGGWWRLRDAVEYMLTGSMATLDYAAKFKQQLLFNRYRAGMDAIERYLDEPPYAWFIPQDQRDPMAPVELLRRMAFNGIEVHQLRVGVEFEGREHPAGTWVIRMDQEFSELVRQVFDVQVYPDLRDSPEGPVAQPYDAAAWTLPYQMDVRVIRATEPLTETVRSAMEPVAGARVSWSLSGQEPDAASFDSVPGVGFDTDEVASGIVPLESRLTGEGPTLVVDPGQNNSFRAINRAWREGGGVSYSDGRYHLHGLDEEAISGLVGDLMLRAERGAGGGAPVEQPRIGLYRPWNPSMDEGWTRWLLERYEFEFKSLRNADFKGAPLEDRFDVIVFSDLRSRLILTGFPEGSAPPRYTGGIGQDGVRALGAFVRSGGTLVCMNGSSNFAIEALNLPVRNALGELSRREFFVGGSILEIEVDATQPVMAGMPERAKVFFEGSPAFKMAEGFEGQVLARYADAGSPLASGYLFGEEHLHGLAAALNVAYGDGRVLLIGFRPQWRAQPFGTFRVLFNSLLFHGLHAQGG